MPDPATSADPAATATSGEPEGAPEPWALEDVYDPETLALIDERTARRSVALPAERRGRSGPAGLLLAGVMTGVAEVLEPDRLQPEMVEFTPDRPDPESMPVQFIHVVGDPAASRLIIRPWLFRRHR